MSITPKTYSDIFSDIKSNITANTYLDNWTSSSRIGAIVGSFSAELASFWNDIASFEEDANLTTAKGEALDNIGALYGIARLAAKSATTIGFGPTIKFTNNSAGSITVPTSTRIWSSLNREVVYSTSAPVTIAAGAEAFVDASAVTAGAHYNVGVGALNTHNAAQSITVTNIAPISNGEFTESDSNYAYRISNAPLLFAGGNSTAVRLACLRIPGVKDVLIRSGARGTGTLDVVVYSVDPHVSDALLDQVQSALLDTVSFGIDVRAVRPIERKIYAVVKLVISSTLSDPRATRDSVKAAARIYIDNLPIGDGYGDGDFIFNELVQRIMDVSPDIIDADISISVDYVPQLQTNLRANIGERFVAESVRVI